MPIEHGKVGSDKSFSNINIFEISVREGEGCSGSGGVGLSRSSIMHWKESFNFLYDFLHQENVILLFGT